MSSSWASWRRELDFVVFHCQVTLLHTDRFLTHAFTCRRRSRTLKDLNDVQLSKIIDSMEEVCIQMPQCEFWGLIAQIFSYFSLFWHNIFDTLLCRLSGEVPGQRCHSSRRSRSKHILHHPKRRGNVESDCVHRLIFKLCMYHTTYIYCITPFMCFFSLQVLVTKNVNGHQKQIRRMGKGEHFGEQALIR